MLGTANLDRHGRLLLGCALIALLTLVHAQRTVAQAPATPEPAVPQAAPSPPADCFPACRAGYVCGDGQCVSACNPPCAANEDCTADATCVARAVAEPAAAPAAPSPSLPAAPLAPLASPVQAAPEPSVGGVNLHVNLLGLLQFGLMPRIELGGATTFLLGGHFFNTGAASYLLIPNRDDDEVFVSGLGGNLGLRHYTDPHGNQRGFYLGGFFEFARIVVEDDSDDRATYTTDVVVVAGEVGTRWVWGSFLLDFGLLFGAAIPVAASDEPIGADGCRWESSCLEQRDTFPFAMLTLDVGLFL